MGKIRRKFDTQFKIQVCQAIEAGTHTVLNICQDHQIQRPVVESWMSRYVSGALTSKSPNRESELARENEKLKAKIGELTMTIDLLKKVEVWKRQQKDVNLSIITAKNLAQFQKPVRPSGSEVRPTTTSRNVIRQQRLKRMLMSGISSRRFRRSLLFMGTAVSMNGQNGNAGSQSTRKRFSGS